MSKSSSGLLRQDFLKNQLQGGGLSRITERKNLSGKESWEKKGGLGEAS